MLFFNLRLEIMLRLLIVSLSTAAPQSEHEHLQYFLKPETENIAQVVQFGTVQGAPVYALLRLITSVYVPRCQGDTSWPDTIKKEFTSQMHRFMATLTECAWDQRGTTRLYIPSEVQFWSSRSVDLSGIHEQLEREGVKRIVAVLELAKSSCVEGR